MLKNYFKIKEDMTVKKFLKNLKEKKNSHYIILDTDPISYVDIRDLALKINDPEEKLKNLKKNVALSNSVKIEDMTDALIESGERLVICPGEQEDVYFDFIDALKYIEQSNAEFLNEPISTIKKKEVFAVNENDKISSVKNLFMKKKVNILPIIENLKLVGEVRPIDLLVSDLIVDDKQKTGLYNSKYKESAINLPISNIMNKRPLSIQQNAKIKNLIAIMTKKKLPSIIILDGDNLHSIVSYQDIFKLLKDEGSNNNFAIEYLGTSSLYEDELELVKKFAQKSMNKINRMSKYDNLKIHFKTIGDKDASHRTRYIIKGIIRHGNSIIQAETEISTGTSDEIFNDKVKENWNTTQSVQNLLKILEKKVIDEKQKKKNKVTSVVM